MTDITPDSDPTLEAHILGSLEKILLQNNADPAIKEIDQEIEEIQELFVRTKSHTVRLLDDMDSDNDPAQARRMNTAPNKKRVSPLYISAQMGNLISLKNLKMSMLKHKTSLNDTILDRAYKVITQINREKAAAGANGDVPLDKLLNLLMEAGVVLPTSLTNGGKSDVPEADVDAALMELIEENGIKSIRLDANGNPMEEDEYLKSLEAAGINPGINEISDDVEDDTLADAYCVYVDGEEEKIYIVNADYEVLKEIADEDELDLEETETGAYFSNAYKLPVEISEAE